MFSMTSESTRQIPGNVSLSPAHYLWPVHFRNERKRLAAFLGTLSSSLVHFGSTAVPNLDAKPIIDMMAPVATLAEAELQRETLKDAEYSLVEADFSKRRMFRRQTSVAESSFHLHLVVCPDWPIKNELLFRDWLVEHTDVAREYAALKRQLAIKFANDTSRYTVGKSDFIRRVVNTARVARGLPLELNWSE
jgi:GrpB-like predicted nucleotidyltransferase (UPF0157 family)